MKVEEYEHEGVPVIIYQDENPSSPREWCNLGEMVCWHGRYDLGDRKPEGQEIKALERGGMRLLERYLRIVAGATVVIPLGLIDHSGISMYAGGGAHWSDSAGWDSGTVGFMFDTPATREQCGSPLDLIEKGLLDEIETYDQYLTGDVYGYVVADGRDDEDSCWGFYGIEDVQEEANSVAAVIATERAELRKLPWLPTFGNPVRSQA